MNFLNILKKTIKNTRGMPKPNTTQANAYKDSPISMINNQIIYPRLLCILRLFIRLTPLNKYRAKPITGTTPTKNTNSKNVIPCISGDKSSFSCIVKRNPYRIIKVKAQTNFANLLAILSSFSMLNNYTTIGQEGGEIIYGII